MRISQSRFDKIRKEGEALPDSYSAFESAISGLSDSQRHELLAIVYLGRGDASEWKEALSQVTAPSNIADYLADKDSLVAYLRRGWSSIPEPVRSKVRNDARDRLKDIIETVEGVVDDLQVPLSEVRRQPETVSLRLLRLSSFCRGIKEAVEENPRMNGSWYYEKSENLGRYMQRAVSLWVESQEAGRPSPFDSSSSDEWVKERLLGDLRETRKAAHVLRQAVTESEIDLLDY